jgi:dihydroorotate dehydrogenase (NAD+) catalytic subunit
MQESSTQDYTNLATQLGPLSLATPIVAASGTFGYGNEFAPLADLSYFGAIILKAVSLEPRTGNPYPRIVETPSGMLNTIGLENPGVEAFIEHKLPDASELGVPLIANLVGNRIEDYVELAKILDKQGALMALEVNASCPNVDHGYMSFSADSGVLSDLVKSVKAVTQKPLIAKLSPNVTDIVPLAKSAIDAGADILDLSNTFLGMSICVETRKSRVSRDYAGLSGRAIRPLALRIVHQVASSLHCPIIGTGGIYTTIDAIEFFIAGATSVSLGTVNFIQPNRAMDICTELSSYLCAKKMTLGQLVGSYQGPGGKGNNTG